MYFCYCPVFLQYNSFNHLYTGCNVNSVQGSPMVSIELTKMARVVAQSILRRAFPTHSGERICLHPKVKGI